MDKNSKAFIGSQVIANPQANCFRIKVCEGQNDVTIRTMGVLCTGSGHMHDVYANKVNAVIESTLLR